jgi:hypothetical protein
VEQASNALDALRAGLATFRTDFDLSILSERGVEANSPARESFRRWVRSGPEIILPLLEAAARGDDPMTPSYNRKLPRSQDFR